MHQASRLSRFALGMGLLALCCPLAVKPATVPERLVMSALVYNIAKLTEWPADALGPPDAPMTLCLLRDRESYQGTFASVEGKSVKGRALELRPETRLSQLDSCRLLYLDDVDEPKLAVVLKAVQGLPVLTVGGFDGFADGGGMVGLFLEQEQMQLRINRHAVAAAHLELSSQLLRMARIVDGPGP